MRILFVLPDLPHPPFTGAHTRPLTLLRAAARAHEVAVVGAAAADADLSLLRELCADVRVAPAGAARPARRRTLAAGRRLVTPVPLVSAGRSRAVSELVDEMVASWKPDAMLVETLYAAHYRAPDVPLIVDLPDVPSGLCESAAAARPVRYAAANLQAATSRLLRAPAARRRDRGGHQRRRPRAPRHPRRGVVHRAAGDRPASRGRHLRAQRPGAPRRGRAPALHRFVRAPAQPGRRQVAGQAARARAAHGARALRPGHRRAARPAVAAARPAAPASASSRTHPTWTRSTAAPTSCSRPSPTAAAPRTRRSRRWPGGCR